VPLRARFFSVIAEAPVADSNQPNRAPGAEQPPSGWKFALRALRHRNYRLFFTGQSVSLVGTWMTRVATAWLVYRLTHSPFLLGLVSFSGQIPAFLLGPFAGVWVDRLDRHRVLVATQVLSMLQSFALAALALTGVINVWEIIALAVCQGAINAFDMPARQAFVIQMIESHHDLSNAIALNSSMVNGARMIGPSLAGIIIAGFGEGYCFLIDGVSYIAVIVSLLAMVVSRAEGKRRRIGVLHELAEGWHYVARFAPIRSILLMLALMSFAGMPYMALMPIFAGSVLHGGPDTLGFLMAASGVGALGGALTLALRRSVVGLGRMIAIADATFGAALLLFALSRWMWLSMALMLFTGFGMMLQMASSNTILQTIVEEDKRGRVMSFYAMAFMGAAPVGSLVAGLAAKYFGAPLTLGIGGAACLAGSVWFASRLPAIRKLVRPIYIRLGILPEVASGLQAATALELPPEE
jgi:MFS family permease